MKLEITVNVHHAADPDVVRSLQTLLRAAEQLLKGQKTIMATQSAEAQRLNDLGAKLDKISGETTGLVTQVRDLKDQIANMGSDASPELTAAIDALVGKAEAIDGLVDDVAPNPTETPPADA